jgi:hypothetical protein
VFLEGKMTIPEKVKIGGMTYKITLAEQIATDQGINGEIRYAEGEIAIKNASTFSQEYKDCVFLHECVHGIFEALGLKQDEGLTDKIAKGLHMLVKDNPEMFK